MIYSKEMMSLGKMIEIILLIIGIVFLFANKVIGVFLIALILFDWLFSIFFEKKKFNDWFYSWKCLFKIKHKMEDK